MPNRAAQAALLARVYHEGAIEPERLSFIECHGTGTRVGDPAEAFAIGETLAQKRSRPLPIGSIKTNLGHLEPASGLVGTLKAILALEHDLLPQSLHCVEPNPDIPFDELNLKIATSALPLPRVAGGRYAGINSFGFGGTNAHVVLADPPRRERTRKGRRPGAAIPPALGAQPCGSERACVALCRPARRRAAARRAGRRLGRRASPRHAAEPSCGDLENARRDCRRRYERFAAKEATRPVSSWDRRSSAARRRPSSIPATAASGPAWAAPPIASTRHSRARSARSTSISSRSPAGR